MIIEHSNTLAATLVVYLITMFVVGFLAYRQTRDLSDYILGGRRLGSWVAALSAGASDMSGWLMLGLPGLAYASGLSAGWIAIGLLIGTYANWRLIAARLRRYTELAGDSLTLPEFFERRFGDRSHLLRTASSGFILVFFLFYTSSGLVASGRLFSAVFGTSYESAVLVGAVAVVGYTFLGGFLAVSWTDLFQGLLMAFALVLLPAMAITSLGGMGPTLDLIRFENRALLNFFALPNGDSITVLSAISLLGWGLGYFGQPHILARFKAIRSVDHIPAARRIAVSWTGVTLAGAITVGLSGIAYLSTPLTGVETEKVFIFVTTELAHPIVAGILTAAILAAIMSTADSQLLVSASTLTEDLYRLLLRKNATQKELVWISRLAVLSIALVALALAWNPDRLVLDLVAYAWAGFGAAFGPTLILAIYWRRMNRIGALSGILTGGITVVAWKLLEGGFFDLYELVPAFFFSAAAGLIGSLLTRPPDAHLTSIFDLATKRWN